MSCMFVAIVYIKLKKNLLVDRQKTPQKDEFTMAGHPIRLVCNTSIGNNTDLAANEAVWYKDGETIESNEHFLLTR